MAATVFELRGEHIELAALLKATGLAHSGSAAKALAVGGQVHVNGETETRRGRKLRPGDEVAIGDTLILVRAAAAQLPR